MKKKKIDSISLIAWKSVARKLFRNIALVLAVTLLVALLVFAMLFNKAVKEDLDAAAKKLGADIVLVPPDALGRAEEFILESQEKTFYMSDFVYESVMDLPEIETGTYQIYLNTLASECCSIEEGQVIAFDPDTDFVVKSWMKDTPPLRKGEVYIGSYVYDYLGLIQTAKLFGTGVKIVAHLDQTNTGLDQGIFMRIQDLETISDEAKGAYEKGMVSIIFLKTKEGLDPDIVAQRIQSLNPQVGIMTRGTIGGAVRKTLKDIIKIFSITIMISALLSIMLAWSTFTAMTNERKRDVGILRAIGARRSHIIQLFMTEAVIISSIGGLLGILLGHYLISHLANNFHLLTKLGAMANFTSQNFAISSLALVIGVGVCMIGALIPVTRLAWLEPLLAIKEE